MSVGYDPSTETAVNVVTNEEPGMRVTLDEAVTIAYPLAARPLDTCVTLVTLDIGQNEEL